MTAIVFTAISRHVIIYNNKYKLLKQCRKILASAVIKYSKYETAQKMK